MLSAIRDRHIVAIRERVTDQVRVRVRVGGRVGVGTIGMS